MIATSIAIGAEPANADLRQQLGRILQRSGLINEAIEEFKVAISLDPHQLSPLIEITKCYLILKDSASARQFFSLAEVEAVKRGQTLEKLRLQVNEDGL